MPSTSYSSGRSKRALEDEANVDVSERGDSNAMETETTNDTPQSTESTEDSKKSRTADSKGILLSLTQGCVQ